MEFFRNKEFYRSISLWDAAFFVSIKFIRAMNLNIYESSFTIWSIDILHIVKGYLLTQLDLEQSSGTLDFVQSENGDIQVVAAFGEISDDSIQNLNLQALANKINWNGPVSSLDESFLIDFNSPKVKQKLQKLLEKLKDGEIQYRFSSSF